MRLSIRSFSAVTEKLIRPYLNGTAVKIKGEFSADLDSAKVLAQDNYYRTIFKGHDYGVGRQEVLENISSITKEDLLSAWNEVKNFSQKIFLLLVMLSKIE